LNVNRLFVYGTLLAPELLRAIIGRSLQGVPAFLSGYSCYRVRRAAYPAVTREAGALTYGSLFSGIDRSQWESLDEFESNLYERHLVDVSLADESDVDAYTYVIANAHRDRLTCEAWDFEHFRRHHLNRYLRQLSD